MSVVVLIGISSVLCQLFQEACSSRSEPEAQYSYLVRVINPEQRSKYMTNIWHHVRQKFDSPDTLKLRALKTNCLPFLILKLATLKSAQMLSDGSRILRTLKQCIRRLLQVMKLPYGVMGSRRCLRRNKL